MFMKAKAFLCHPLFLPWVTTEGPSDWATSTRSSTSKTFSSSFQASHYHDTYPFHPMSFSLYLKATWRTRALETSLVWNSVENRTRTQSRTHSAIWRSLLNITQKNNTCLSLFILANLKLSNFCWHQRHFFSCSILARACGLFLVLY